MIASNSNTEVLENYDVASDSDASDLYDFDYNLISVSSGPGAVALSEDDLLSSEYAESVIAYTPVQVAADSETDYVNCLRLDCVIDGESVIVLLPPESIDKIFIDDQNRLWNMSTSNITGRIVDAQFNPYQTEGEVVYLTPCLGNNFSTIRRYGSPNYIRHYYYSGSSLIYDDTYTEIVVEDYHYPFFSSDMWSYGIVFILMIGVILAWLRNYKNY